MRKLGEWLLKHKIVIIIIVIITVICMICGWKLWCYHTNEFRHINYDINLVTAKAMGDVL